MTQRMKQWGLSGFTQAFQHHLHPFKPHCPPVFPFSKASVVFPCATQRRRDLVKPESAMHRSAAFGKKGVISEPQERRNNWPARGECLQHTLEWHAPMLMEVTQQTFPIPVVPGL